MKEIKWREKKEKTSSEARKPIVNLNCTKPLMGKYSDGKKGVRDCKYDFNYFWQRIILLNSNEGSAGVQLHLNCLNCMGWQMNADLFGSVTFSLYERFDKFSRNLAISFPLAASWKQVDAWIGNISEPNLVAIFFCINKHDHKLQFTYFSLRDILPV